MMKYIFVVSIIANTLNSSAPIPIPPMAIPLTKCSGTEFRDTTHHYYRDPELQSIKQKLLHACTKTHKSTFNSLSCAITPKKGEKVDLNARYQQVALLTEHAIAIRNAHSPKHEQLPGVSRYTLDWLTGESGTQLANDLNAPFPKALACSPKSPKCPPM